MVGKELLLVKYGSSCVSGRTGIDQSKIDSYAEQIASISHQYHVAVVSSGSIAVGKKMWEQRADRLGGKHPTVRRQPSNQILAMMGSAPAVVAWQQAFDKQDIPAGQIQATHKEIRDPKEGKMLVKTIEDCVETGVISIINENDALSNEEINAMRYGGDNDALARYLAARLGAHTLCLLTANVEGLLDENGKLIRVVKARDTQYALSVAGGAGEEGRGGMYSKVTAATAAAASAIRTHIANASRPIEAVLRSDYGTHFPPH